MELWKLAYFNLDEFTEFFVIICYIFYLIIYPLISYREK